MNIEKQVLEGGADKVVISGSLRKNKEQIASIKELFEEFGIKVLAPEDLEGEIVNEGSSFVRFPKNNPNSTNSEIEKDFMRNIREANFLYVANIDGYIGQSVATEIGYAGLKNMPIILSENIKKISDDVPEEAREILKKLVYQYFPTDNIDREGTKLLIEKLKDFNPINLSQEEKEVLYKMIKVLIKELQGKTN